MISSSLRALGRALTAGFAAVGRLSPEQLCRQVAAAGEASAAACDDEHRPARMPGGASSLAAGRRR